VLTDFIAGLAKQLVIRSFVNSERLPIGQLYVLRRGLVVKMWRFLSIGKVWGEDVIVDNPELIDHSQAVGLTYVETYTLRRNDLDDVLLEFPVAAQRVHRAARRVALARSLLRYLCMKQGRTPRSVALRSDAKGFVTVNETLTMEQKVSELYECLVQNHSAASAMAEGKPPPGTDDVQPFAPRGSILGSARASILGLANSRKSLKEGADAPKERIERRGSVSIFQRRPSVAMSLMVEEAVDAQKEGSISRNSSPTPRAYFSSPGGGDDKDTARKVDEISAQLSQLLAAQNEMASAVFTLTQQMKSIQQQQRESVVVSEA